MAPTISPPVVDGEWASLSVVIKESQKQSLMKPISFCMARKSRFYRKLDMTSSTLQLVDA